MVAPKEESWHEMVDRLALEAGHRDNLKLAEAFCAAAGNESQTAFDTAIKNLRNWRTGVHLPQRRNLLILSQILGVDELDEAARQRWLVAYKAARRQSGTQSAASDEEPAEVKPRPMPDGRQDAGPAAAGAGREAGRRSRALTFLAGLALGMILGMWLANVVGPFTGAGEGGESVGADGVKRPLATRQG